MLYNKKILCALFGVFLYLTSYYFVSDIISKNNEFPELNNIELFYKSNADVDVYRDNIISKLNQYDGFVSYAYFDNSKDIILNNSLKNKSIKEIDLFTNFFKTPSINNLFSSFADLSASDDGEINSYVLQNFINNLFNLCFDNKHKDYSFDYLINSLLSPRLDDYYQEFDKIIILSEKQYSSSVEKEENLIDLFKFIESVDRYNNIKHIKFGNRFAYDVYLNYKDEVKSSVSAIFKPLDVFYVDSVDSLKVLKNDLNAYLGENFVRSLLDYTTPDKIVGDKYKKIKNLSIYVSAYSKVNDLSRFDYDKLLVDLKNIENNIVTSNSQLANKLNHIYKYFENNDIEIIKLINQYNFNCPNYIGGISNTEVINIDAVSPLIKNDFYNERLGKYVIKIESQSKDYTFYKRFLFNGNNSLYYNCGMFLLNLIFAIFFSVGTVLTLLFRKAKK
tara:strand:+ start:435 stop:1775 length:1341 start_codon:yes stop_codon:yes gene_type:complete